MPERRKAVTYTTERIIGPQHWRIGDCQSMDGGDYWALWSLVDGLFVHLVEKIDWNRVFTTASMRCELLRENDPEHATFEPFSGATQRLDYMCPQCMIEALLADETVQVYISDDEPPAPSPRRLAEHDDLDAARPVSALFERLVPVILRHLRENERREVVGR